MYNIIMSIILFSVLISFFSLCICIFSRIVKSSNKIDAKIIDKKKKISPTRYALISSITIFAGSFVIGLFVIFTSVHGTAAIGLIFLPFYALFLGVVGFIITWVIISLYIIFASKHSSNTAKKANLKKSDTFT